MAEHSPSFPDQLRPLARRALSDDVALERFKHALLKLSPAASALMGTTQAVDIVQGGVKVNALPERAMAIVNHRIAEHRYVHTRRKTELAQGMLQLSTVSELQQHLIQVLHPVACKYDLTFTAFGQLVHTGQAGQVSISEEYGSALNPSPVTPAGDGPYAILAGTIRTTMESSTFYNVTQVVVAPSLALGESYFMSLSLCARLIPSFSRQYWCDRVFPSYVELTFSHALLDTQFYWNLTKHIFRFSPTTLSDCYNGFHTVNEGELASSPTSTS